jgi:hypothetical protein
MEFLRLDATPMVSGVRLPILVSLGVIGVSVILIVIKALKHESIETNLF